jgi:hypothetical protein
MVPVMVVSMATIISMPISGITTSVAIGIATTITTAAIRIESWPGESVQTDK